MPDDPNQSAGGAPQDQPLSQADIDAALNAASDPAPGQDESEAGASAAGAPSAASAQSPADDPQPDQDPQGSSTGDGPVSQDDIDALMAAASGGAPSRPDATAGAGPDSSAAKATDPVGDSAAAVPVDDRVDSCGRPFDALAAEMAAAIEEEKAAAAAAAPATASPARPAGGGPAAATKAFALPDLAGGVDADLNHDIDLLHDVNLHVKIELGRTRMLVEDVLRLGEGSVVELDKLAGDPVDVYANDRLIARGEVLVLNDNFCVRVGEIISNGHGPSSSGE